MKTINLQPDIKLTIRTLKYDKQLNQAVRIYYHKTVQMGTIFPFETSEKKIIEWAKNAVKTNKHLFTASDIPENTGYMMENF